MASYIVPSKSRSNGSVVYQACEEKVHLPVFGPKNNTSPFVRYSYKERLEYALIRKWRKNPYEAQYKLKYFAENGAIWYDNIGETWVQIPAELFQRVIAVVWSEMLSEVRKKDRKFGRAKSNRVYIDIRDYPQDEDVPWEDVFEEEVDYDVPVPLVMQKRKHKVYHAEMWPEDHVYEQDFELVRNENLLVRLRDKLWYYSFLRKPLRYIRNCYNRVTGVVPDPGISLDNLSYHYVEHQMDSAHGESEDSIKTSNVVLGETEQDSKVDEGLPQIEWSRFSTSEPFDTGYDRILDRFTLYDTFEWSVDQNESTVISETRQPLDTVNLLCKRGGRGNVPFCVPFNIHKYWTGDLEFKVHVNSNKFQVGMLQVSWWYYSNDLDVRKNIYTNSQLPHALISAGSSNEATLTIPYKHWRPLLHTKKRKDFATPLALGRLMIMVLSPLAIAPKALTPKTCGVSLFVRIINSKFTGLVDGGINVAEGEMLGVSTLAKVASTVLKDFNCDNPTDISPVKYLIPTASHSWCAGTGVNEQLQNLRLDYSCLGVNRSGDMDGSETLVKNVVSRFGLLLPFEWSSVDSAKNKMGYKLYEMNVHPMADKNRMRSWPNARMLTDYSVPPVGVVSSMYMYWRGSLELRFDIIASSFHTGRLLIAYIPGVSGDASVTIEQARNSAHAVFSLNDSTSFTFIVPYIADRPWWHRRYAGPQKRHEISAPSKLFIFVLNPLVPMDQVTSTIKIYPYIRGGADFEVAVPVQPALGRNENKSLSIASDFYATNVDGYAPVYLGTWHSFASGTEAMLRYGPGSDHVAQFMLPTAKQPDNTFAVWTPVNDEIKGITFDGIVRSYKNFITWHDSSYIYMFPVWALSDAKIVARGLQKGKGPGDFKQYLVTLKQDGNYASQKKIYFRPQYFALDDVRDEYVFVRGQNDERTVALNVLKPTANLPTTSYGMKFFNENFGDLKDLCRRYQLLWTGFVHYDNSGSNGKNSALFTFPACPEGLQLITSSQNAIWNLMREGHIPLICDGFRYYRGSLRYKLVLPASFTGNVWVQHHPDKPLDGPRVLALPSAYNVADSVRNHSYAYYVQSTRVNNILEFEIPCYISGNYLILGERNQDVNTDASDFYSLGEVVIGFESVDVIRTDVQLSLYYSIGDDGVFSIFTGFLPKVFCDEAYSFVEPQMFSAVSSYAFGALGSVSASMMQNGLGKIKHAVRNEVMSGIRETLEPTVDKITERIAPTIQVMESELQDWMKNVGMTVALTQLLHIINDPNPRTLAISVIGILAIMCQATMSAFVKILRNAQEILTGVFVRHWRSFMGRASDPQEDLPDNTFEFQSDFIDNLTKKDIFSLSSCIFSLWTAGIGVTCTEPKNYPNFLRGVNGQVSLLNNVITLLKNIGDTIVYVVRHILGCVNEQTRLEMIANSNVIELREWVLEVNKLLDPRMMNKLLRNQNYSNRVFDACLYGSILITEDLHKTCAKPRVLLDTYRELCKLRDRIIQMGNHPDVRFECFVVWLAGHRGIGKSFITDSICAEMLKTINYKTDEAMIYWLTSTTKYWNGVRNPPVIARDDAFNLDGTLMEEELGNYFMIKSSSVLNPSMAAVEDKNKRLNPLIYFLNSNFTFPSIAPAKMPEAVYRRRQALIEAAFTDEIVKKYGDGDANNIASADDLPMEEKENFKHLKFRWSKNPAQDREENWSVWMNYQEMMKWLCPKFKSAYQREQVNFQRRIQTAYCLSEGGDSFDLPELEVNDSLKERVERAKRLAQDKLQRMHVNPEEESYITQTLRDWGERLTDYWASRPEHQSPDAVPGCSFWTDEEAFATNCLYQRYADDACKQVFESVLFGEEQPSKPSNTHFWERWCDITGLLPNTLSIMVNSIEESSILNKDMVNAFIPLTSHMETNPHYYPLVMWGIDWRSIIPQIPFHVREISMLEEYDQCVQYWRLCAYRHLVASLRTNRVIHTASDGLSERVREALEHHDLQRVYVDSPEAACMKTAFFVEHLPSIKEVRYCAIRDKFVFKNIFGLTTTINARCTCEGDRCIFQNPMLNNLIQHVWDTTHSNNAYNFTSRTNVEIVNETWCEKVSNFFECAWQHHLKPAFTYILSWIVWALPRIATMLMTMALAAGLTFVGRTFFGVGGSEQGFPEAGANYFKFDSPKFQNAQQNFNKSFAQTTDQRNVLINLVENNTVVVSCTYIRDEQRRDIHGRCLIIRGRSLLILRHYYEEHRYALQFNPKFHLHFNVGGKQTFREVLFEDIYGCMRKAIANNGAADSNYCLCELPTFIPQFKSIVRHIATAAQHNNLSRVMDLLITGDTIVRDLEFKKSGKFIVASTGAASDVQMENAYTYNKQGRGMCGSLVVCYNVNNGNGAIIGMHVAGSPASGLGIAEPLFREMFDVYLDNVKYPVVADLNLKQVEITKLDTNLLLLGKVEPEYAHHESGKSKIIPSLIAGAVYPVKTEVNPLRPNDPRQPVGSDPLFDGCRKHGTGILVPLPKSIMDSVQEDLRATMMTQVLPVRQKIQPLTEQQAICGDVEVKHFEALNWTSSEGFPLSKYRPKGSYNKKWLFNLEETSGGYVLKGMDEHLKQLIAARRKAYAEGIVPPTVYVDCLKDYRLTPEKCRIPGKTRIFSISPVQTTIDIKIHLGDFMASYKDSFIKAEHAIGINPDSLDWTRVVHYLSEVGGNIVTGDYSNFGPCLNSEFVLLAINSIRDWHKFNNAPPDMISYATAIMEEEILNPIHLCEDVVYQTLNGIASGSAMTGEINSEVNKCYIRAVYLLIMKDMCSKYASMAYFHQFVRLLVYGDDFIMSVNDEIIQYFNLENIILYFKKMNITVTSASKDDTIEKYSSLEQSTFLKRGFKKHPYRSGIVLAPVEVQSVQECINWVHKSNDASAALLEVCRASMDLAYGHGPDFYQEHGDRLVHACRSHNIDFRYTSWLDKDHEIFGDSQQSLSGISLKIRVPAYMAED